MTTNTTTIDDLSTLAHRFGGEMSDEDAWTFAGYRAKPEAFQAAVRESGFEFTKMFCVASSQVRNAVVVVII